LRILLDTNAYSSLMRGTRDLILQAHRSKRVFLSTIVVGELLYGFFHGSRREDNLRRLSEFLADSRVTVVPVSFTTAELFGRISAGLRRKGSLIPSNDIWIAAHAMETGSSLLSYDPHFERVEGLDWRALS
jgi:tRNA(fMet)-specific endonuclease VapC